MKRKYQRKKEKMIFSKKNANSKLDDFFKSPTKARNVTSPIKRDISSLFKNSNTRLCIVRNPSKSKLLDEAKEELKKFHNLAEKTILCDNSLIDKLYEKLNSSFEKIERYIKERKKYNIKKINKKELIIKFILQLKYTDVVYLSPVLLSEKFNEDKIAQSIRNLVGFNSLKGITMNYSPNNINECEIFWPNITEIISKYFRNFQEGRGLYIYVEHDYLSYLDKIKLLCNLNNYETSIIDETNQSKCIILDKLSEAMKTKRLPSISDNLGSQMLMLEEMVNSFSYKWKIFTKKEDNNNFKQKNIEQINNYNNFGNNINNISYNNTSESKNDTFILSEKDINKVFKEIDFKSENNAFDIKNNLKEEKFIRIDDYDENSKNDQLSTNETSLFSIFQRKGKNKIKTNDINLEESEYIWHGPEKTKSRDKSKTNSRNKSSELKKRRNKKIEDNINNTNIKGYFNENTKEHKTFTQLQNNIFLYCTKAKTAIIIADSFSEEEKDKKYFNNILLKISQTKCPIIILTNNINNIYNNTQKKIKNLSVNCILSPKNKRNIELIYLYNFIIYINIKLCSFKFNKDINSYEKLLENINNINTEMINFELSLINLKKIFNMSECICYKGKFQIDIIDLRLSEIFLKVENEINNNNLYIYEFEDILDYIYNLIFGNNNSKIYEEEKNIDEISQDYELKSFLDYSEGIKEIIINKNYEEKLKLNDSFSNYCEIKDSMVNLEGLILSKHLNNKEIFNYALNDNSMENYSFIKKNSFNEAVNNKIFNKLNKEKQLFISNFTKKYIQISSISNYTFPIKRKMIIDNNRKNKITFYIKNSDDENNIFVNVHFFKKLFEKIEGNFFLNKNNIDFATNSMIKEGIKQKKIKVNFYEK